MNDRLQIQLFGPYFSSFSAHSYGYELANELKSVLNLLDFRFGPYSRTASSSATDIHQGRQPYSGIEISTGKSSGVNQSFSAKSLLVICPSWRFMYFPVAETARVPSGR